MSTHLRAAAVLSVVILGAAGSSHAQHQMPPGMTHEEHLKQMQKEAELRKRGAAAMGFDQDTTAHHFLLAPDGGTIEVEVKDPSDESSRGRIRAHLQEIARDFARGDFAKPLATHGETPPGVRTMQTLTRAIAYRYEETPSGGRVRISSSNPTARAAIQEFLRYQIREHGTGDPLPARK
jgi:hypothetical protein